MADATTAERRAEATRALSAAYRHLAKAEADAAKAQAEVKQAREQMLEVLGLDPESAAI